MGSLDVTPTLTWSQSWSWPRGLTAQWELVRYFGKDPEPYAIDCVLAYLDSWGLVEVTLKADNEPAIQALVDGVRSKRGERTMVEKSPKYSHQSNGVAENAVQRIEKPLQDLRLCAAEEAQLQSRQQEHHSAVASFDTQRT